MGSVPLMAILGGITGYALSGREVNMSGWRILFLFIAPLLGFLIGRYWP